MRRYLIVFLWFFMVFLTARLVPNWRMPNEYAQLIPPAAKQVLAQQTHLNIDVFALPGSPAASLVGNFLKPLLTSLPSVQVNYIDPSQQVELVQQHQITQQGEMLVQSGEADFKLSTLSYEAFFNGLKRMTQPADQWLVFLDNFGGSSFDAGTPGGLNEWLNALAAANYPSTVMSWRAQLKLPRQTALIVLSSPSVEINQTQLMWLEQQMAQGTSLLWLVDPQTVDSQPNLSLLFDVMKTDAFHQGHLVIKDFPNHPINQTFDRPLDLVGVMPFVTANQPLWVNAQQQAVAATGEVGDSRLMVIGDSDFLSDQFIHNGGNLEMSFRLLDWLLKNHERIDLPSIGHQQTQLFLTQSEVLTFAGLMLLLLPLLFLVMSLYHWRKQKRG